MPYIVSKFFESSNIMKPHKQDQQDMPCLLYKRRARYAYFCLASSHNGIKVISCYHLPSEHKVITYSSKHFSGMLSHQVMYNARYLVASINLLEKRSCSCILYLGFRYGLWITEHTKKWNFKVVLGREWFEHHVEGIRNFTWQSFQMGSPLSSCIFSHINDLEVLN
jgi:hypothetical protein